MSPTRMVGRSRSVVARSSAVRPAGFLLVLIVAGVGLAGCGGHGHESSAVPPGARRIEVSAGSFRFEPAELEVRAGEPIAIALSSTDVEHDLVIDEFDAHVYAGAGETAEGGFTAGEPGSYPYYCSIEGHRDAGMEGTLIVAAPS